MRKTTAYARKRAMAPTYNGAEYLNTIMRSRGYTEQPMPEVDSNPMLPPLVDGNNALRQVLNRRRTWGKWQVLPAEAETLRYAVDLYETILLASSPQQMATAVDLRMQALKGQTMETLTP